METKFVIDKREMSWPVADDPWSPAFFRKLSIMLTSRSIAFESRFAVLSLGDAASLNGGSD
jgi:hypothetical protein